MVSEKKLEPDLRKAVEAKKGLCIKLLTFHFTGLPDRLILLPGGRMFFAETKSTGDSIHTRKSKRQPYVKKQLEALGFKVYIIDSKESLKNCLDDL